MMNYRFRFLLMLLWLGALACGSSGSPTATPFATPTPSPLPPTPTLSQALIPTNTPVPGFVPTERPTRAPSPTPDPDPVGPGLAACPTGGNNLLTNASFEGSFNFQGGQELLIAPGWVGWWFQGDSVNFRPEFKPATEGGRVRSGSTAQQYFKSFGQYRAGVYQIVENSTISSGTRLQFSAYGQAWSCLQGENCGAGVSINPANMFMRVGIDPTGGTDANARSVRWSNYFNPIDRYEIACVEAYAEGNRITVFTWSSPDQPRLNQDTYWDDAALVILP